jgi:hypothetical protein
MLERGISEEEIEYTLSEGDVIYHDPVTCKSTILCWKAGRPIHVIVGINERKKIKRVVTVYEPDNRWEDNFKRRRKP